MNRTAAINRSIDPFFYSCFTSLRHLLFTLVFFCFFLRLLSAAPIRSRFSLSQTLVRRLVCPDWAIYWTLGKFLKLLATINLPESTTFLGNFCKGVKISHYSCEVIFWATFIDIWRFFSGHTVRK